MRRFIRASVGGLQGLYGRVSGRDHRLLNGYILGMGQLHDLDSIIDHAARCLWELFHYEGLCFAVHDREGDGGIDIWADPRAASAEFFRKIQEQLEPASLNYSMRVLGPPAKGRTPGSAPEPQDMLTVKVMDGATRARLYLQTSRRLSAHHAELLGSIVRSLATAIGNYMSRKRLETDSLLDPLTRSYNRRALERRLERDTARARGHGTDLSVVMFDIDHFKRVNDRYGHAAGDAVLGALAQSVMASIRSSDYLARYGGEEFVLVLPATRFSKAIEAAERLRQGVQDMRTRVGDATIEVTASFGVAFFREGFDRDSLLRRADQMLYEAKRLGRNRVQPDLRLHCSPVIDGAVTSGNILPVPSSLDGAGTPWRGLETAA